MIIANRDTVTEINNNEVNINGLRWQDNTFLVAKSLWRAWISAGHAVVQSLPHEVCIKQHECHQSHPATQLGYKEPWDHPGNVAAQWPESGHDCEQARHGPLQHLRSGEQPKRPTARAVHARRSSGRLHHRSGRLLLRDQGCGHEAYEEEPSEESVNEGLLSSQVSGRTQARPVHRWEKIPDASSQAEHDGVDGERLMALLFSRVEIRHQRLQRGEAGLTAELQHADGQHQQQNLQPGTENILTTKYHSICWTTESKNMCTPNSTQNELLKTFKVTNFCTQDKMTEFIPTRFLAW